MDIGEMNFCEFLECPFCVAYVYFVTYFYKLLDHLYIYLQHLTLNSQNPLNLEKEDKLNDISMNS